MTFLETEASRTLGSPITLVLFNYGPNGALSLGYTSEEQERTLNGVFYEPVPLVHDAIKARGVEGRSEFNIRLPNETDASLLFRFGPPPTPVSVTVFRGHRLDPDNQFQVVWTGRVLSAQPGANLDTVFNCEWAGSSLRRSGVHRNYQYSCPYVLYGPECRADQAAATVESQVAAFTDMSISPPPTWVEPSRYPDFENGFVSWDSDSGRQSRAIVEVTETGTLLLANRTSGITLGAAISIALGCNRLAGPSNDCVRLHDNIQNFGGQPWIPTDNPINRNVF